MGVGSESSLGVDRSEGSLTPADRQELRLGALELTGSFDPFPCRLNGHDHLASLRPSEAGDYLSYRCADGGWEGGLAEVRAHLAYGEARHLSAVECARWDDLLDFEGGVRRPIVFAGELPDGIGKSARVALESIWLLVGMRELPSGDEPRRFALAEPFVFARDFAVAYTGLSDEAVRYAIEWLEAARVIYRVGKNGHAILWKLTAQDDAPKLIGELHRREAR